MNNLLMIIGTFVGIGCVGCAFDLAFKNNPKRSTAEKIAACIGIAILMWICYDWMASDHRHSRDDDFVEISD